MPRAALAKPTKPAQAVYQLRLTLQETDPPVWRRLLVPSNVSLAKLHKIIQRAMGWSDSHLHQFMVGKPVYDQMRATYGTLGEKIVFQ